MNLLLKKTIFVFSFSALILTAGNVLASEDFYIDSDYDLFKREELSAELVEETDLLYFYIDQNWWDDASSAKKEEVEAFLETLGEEFKDTIYPVLTSEYGSEPNPGIDKDKKITVLIHPMTGGVTGYFNSGDSYSIYQSPRSNEREMVYLDARHITDTIAPSYLAHEFTHLITFNQKEKLNGVQEEVWLNEARAEYAPTLCGYDDDYEKSNIKRRVSDFLKDPSTSLTGWRSRVADYGVLNLFFQYLVDHYGKEILTNSIKSSEVGIESINEALKDRGFSERFSDIFLDWAIAVLVNDCSLGEKYCYLNENLKNLRIVPQSNYLPMGSESILSVFYQTDDWTGNWHKIFGGKGALEFEFDGEDDADFKVPFVLCRRDDSCFVDFLELDKKQRGQIKISDFGEDYSHFTIIPLTREKTSGFNGAADSFSYSWKAKSSDSEDSGEIEIPIEEPSGETKEEKLDRLLALLELVKERIAEILAGDSPDDYSCQRFNNNLYYGITNNEEVRCLQEFLKNQGADIYPEGLVTGNYLNLTRSAVIRFQEKHKDRILTPLGLNRGTGYFGSKTRTVINDLLE